VVCGSAKRDEAGPVAGSKADFPFGGSSSSQPYEAQDAEPGARACGGRDLCPNRDGIFAESGQSYSAVVTAVTNR
jgi:hypothetical protein